MVSQNVVAIVDAFAGGTAGDARPGPANATRAAGFGVGVVEEDARVVKRYRTVVRQPGERGAVAVTGAVQLALGGIVRPDEAGVDGVLVVPRRVVDKAGLGGGRLYSALRGGQFHKL